MAGIGPGCGLRTQLVRVRVPKGGTPQAARSHRPSDGLLLRSRGSIPGGGRCSHHQLLVLMAWTSATSCSPTPEARSDGVFINPPNGTGGTGGSQGPGGVDSCEQVNARAQGILQKNCAYCHQHPAKMGNFDFILNIATLVSANSTAGNKFIVPGSPEGSRIIQRIAAGEMPPRDMMLMRPTSDDLALLRDWVRRCVTTGSVADAGGGGQGGQPDAEPEPPPPGCGGARQMCCDGNTCNDGGCCVIGLCHANGGACNDGLGQGGLAGMCVSGSCVNAGAACGGSGQGCCTGGFCTATRVYCGMSMMCVECGALNQACCGTGGGGTCAAGLDCQGNRFPLAGSCKSCGKQGQPCCGNGPAVTQECEMGLACRFDVTASDALCVQP